MIWTPGAPNACLADTLVCAPVVQACVAPVAESQELKSLHVDFGWAFGAGLSSGTYDLAINGQNFGGPIAGGIRIDRQLNSIAGSGELQITTTDGPVFQADIELGMPPVQTPAGLTQRLTNLGWYAGVRGAFDGRARWAVRAFKRAVMNGFTRHQHVNENDEMTAAFLEAVQFAYGEHANDDVSNGLPAAGMTSPFASCGMFGRAVCRRGSFEQAGAVDDADPDAAGANGVWAGASAANVALPIAGPFPIYLRAFDPAAGDSPMLNRVNLPQPIHMAQFVLFELGYWLVHGAGGWTAVDGSQSRRHYQPDGSFDRYTQWAVREFQCHAKMPNAAKENVGSTEARYLPRLQAGSEPLVGPARYPDAGRVSGALNEATRDALQAWADDALRCPVIVYASTDNNSASANGSDLAHLTQENLWLHDDHIGTAPRMYAIDHSGYYTLPAANAGTVSSGASSFPRPIVVGEYTHPAGAGYDGGPVSMPPRHSWASADAELRPDTMLGTGGVNGAGLTAAQLSTFKAVRTAAHFECFAYFDSLNAYDDVTLSFGPCHWTLARCGGAGAADEGREMPAFFAYVNSRFPAAFQAHFGIFGLAPEAAWPLPMAAQTGTYSTRLMVQTETGQARLCGVTGQYDDNKYGKNWHAYYRAQMACRTSADLRLAMWGFARVRIRDILNKTFNINGVARRVGDHVTSTKGVAMLLRWHIYRPAHLFRTGTPATPNFLLDILTAVIAAHPAANQARETAMLQQLSAVGGPLTSGGLTTIHGWANVPQLGLAGYPYYALNLTDPALSAARNSFNFDAP